MLKQILVDYGFTDKEADIYLTCLELGNAPVSSIARLLRENRVTAYSILKNLVKKGVATEIIKGKTTYYSVISPEKLLRKMEDKCTSLKEALPEFLAIANKYDNKPKVQFFEGFEWLKQLYNDILENPTEDILAFLWAGEVSSQLKDYLNLQFLPKRVTIWLSAKVILWDDKRNRENYEVYKVGNNKLLTEYKVFNHDFFNLYNEINIYGDNKIAIMMFSEEEMSWLIIHSKKLHDTLKSLFNLIWKCCPTNGKPNKRAAKQ